MQIDSLTLDDLAILKGENAIYKLLNRCHTNNGSELLYKQLRKPLQSAAEIIEFQDSVRYWLAQAKAFAWNSTNGSIIMLQKFLNSNDFTDKVSNDIALQFNTWVKKIVQKDSLEEVNFLSEQVYLLLKDAQQLVTIYRSASGVSLLQRDMEQLNELLQMDFFKGFHNMSDKTNAATKIALIHDLKRYGKVALEQLMEVLARADFWRSMALVMQDEQWVLPKFDSEESAFYLQAKGLYHPLIAQAQPYDITFKENQRFLIVTGANMSGKSTFMRAVGVAVVMAHCGFPVAATELQLTYLHALITQINVHDDLSKGESYFYAEVLRMKQTAQRIKQQGRNLIIMDELFKGTNVHDAYDCSNAVIKGLSQKKDNFILLSTHLHELAKEEDTSNGLFYKYFETLISSDNSFKFTYQLKDGVSKDRIGFALLQQEGVIDLLN